MTHDFRAAEQHDRGRSSRGLTGQDLQRIESETWIRQVELHAELSSTNDLALERGASRDAETPLLVVAEQQSAGRGRGMNRWWASQGALTFSLVIDLDPQLVPQRFLPLVSLASAIAVCQSLDELLPNSELGLKWPNDVFLVGRKVCGILVEAISAEHGRLVVGIGINVNNSFSSAPVELQQTGTSICDITGTTHGLTDVLIDVLVRLQGALSWIESDHRRLTQTWNRYCMLSGSNVAIDSGGQRTAGLCHGIADDGALLVGTGNDLKRLYSGVVVQVG